MSKLLVKVADIWLLTYPPVKFVNKIIVCLNLILVISFCYLWIQSLFDQHRNLLFEY